MRLINWAPPSSSTVTLPIEVILHLLYSSFHPQIGDLIAAAIKDNPHTLLSPIPFQFQKFLIKPLSDNIPLQPHIVLVLDALDECGTVEDRETLLNLLASEFCHLPPTFRTIITSRADSDIRQAFESEPHILAFELDLTSDIAFDDISSYFRHHMAGIRRKKKYLPIDWPGRDTIHDLARRAHGLFVWASTAYKFINGYDPEARLDAVLRGSRTSAAESALDTLYRTALQSVEKWDDAAFIDDFRAVVGTVLALRNPLSSAALDSLMGTTNSRSSSINTIMELGCVISSSLQI